MRNGNFKSSNASIGMGGVLIVTIFTVLCLTVFSVLSFVAAYSDLKLAEKSEEMAYDYYAVHGKAEEKLADIYEALIYADENMKAKGGKSDEFYRSLSASLNEMEGVSIIGANDDSSFKIYYEALGNKNQKICLTLNAGYDETSKQAYYDIESWNLSAIEPPVYEEENFDLWKGLE